jgi:hypothetical protein
LCFTFQGATIRYTKELTRRHLWRIMTATASCGSWRGSA